jgi:hypothetical protein
MPMSDPRTRRLVVAKAFNLQPVQAQQLSQQTETGPMRCYIACKPGPEMLTPNG